MNNNLKKRKRKAKMKIAMKIMKLRVNQTAKKMILRKVRPCLVAVFLFSVSNQVKFFRLLRNFER